MPTIISTASSSPPPPPCIIASPSLCFPNPNRLLSPNRPVKTSPFSNHHFRLHVRAAAPLLSPWTYKTSSRCPIFPSFAFTNHSLPDTDAVWEAPDYGSGSDNEEENEEQEQEEDNYYAKKTAQVIQYEEELRKGLAFSLVFLDEVDVILIDWVHLGFFLALAVVWLWLMENLLHWYF